MIRIRFLTLCIALGYTLILFGQRQDISGQLIANGDVEGIHVLNRTAARYTVSDESGRFNIQVQVGDTLFFSGLRYELMDLIITQSVVKSKYISVELVERITELDPIIIGKLLTGSLESDIENSDAKTAINFYDLGIPGSTKLPLTQNERKLFDADSGPLAAIMGGPYGGGMGLNFHKLLNTISGRTKKLKAIVDLDEKDKCMKRLRRNYESIIFEKDTLSANLRPEFFMFAQEDHNFLPICKRANDIDAIDFLKLKLQDYYKAIEKPVKD